MRQFIGSEARPTTVRDVPPRVRRTARRGSGDRARARPSAGCTITRARSRRCATPTRSRTGVRPAGTRRRCCSTSARTPRSGRGYPECAERRIETLSGGERKRLALEVILRSPVRHRPARRAGQRPGHRGQDAGSRTRSRASPKTVLFVSHDRTVLDRAATRIVTLEGRAAWTHHGRFSSYAAARDARVDRLDQDHRRYEAEHRRLSEMVKEMKRKSAYNDGWASKARSAAAPARAVRGDARSRPEKADVQNVRMRIEGGRTGKVALRVTRAVDRRDRRAVRRRVLVRRADRRDRPERHGQDALPAAARGRGRRARRRVEARGARRAGAVRPAARARRRRRPPDRRGAAQAGDDHDASRWRRCAGTRSTRSAGTRSSSCPAASRRGSSSC